ncbi:MAG: Protein-L-isoaspartate O-methyltransferase [Candidatus Jorgensenbacteria bacterium GW2011_GWA1_48_13]|uniref:Protein-L-isoaspartate O-methyltransferase n=1 Tax=Candidatus Jorgensenbacteria bacterium GW2011_GWB1_50_10 TaxID=1618665 RepID=A0A0G1Z7T7_9BACT|nr:MAG: Protein-L-isoaspartate O-methyltransferase [Candidatus Jorgensenbacteria bacterium GW2011_GWA1_48_13]KKW15044.1 MAG: Protein-L-isoaspartate O-methyltransferase [Candidatus Jorgensenbacteria bacterium GW2011_GWB1_50_10]
MTQDKLIKELVRDGYLKSPSIIEAFKKINRADFVPESEGEMAYYNIPLPIGYNQTISQPLTVAFTLELLEPKKGEKILDIGAGSGWQTALLSELVGEEGKVIAIERIPELKNMAEKNVGKYGFAKKGIAEIILGDGSKGYPEEAPYDKIVAAAYVKKIPACWKEQLKIGGRIVAPVGEQMTVLDKTGPDKFEQKQYFAFLFVPLIEGEVGDKSS